MLSVPGRTTVKPSGFSKSEAILDTNFEVDKPPEAGNFVSSFTRFRIVFARAGGFFWEEMSTKASSTLILSSVP